jgi:hypothetical protein
MPRFFFHLPTRVDPQTGAVIETHPIDHLWMMNEYPPDIRAWLMARGGVLNMDEVHFWDFWELEATELWGMGYRRCEPKPPPPTVVAR